MKPVCYPIQQKARPKPCHLQKDVKNELDRLKKSGHLKRQETIVQEYRNGQIEEIAVHYVGINCIVEEKAKRNKQQEDNVRSAELDCMLNLETLIKETAAYPEFIELNCCLEDNNTNLIPNDYRTVAKK